jgi:hypothetical protein
MASATSVAMLGPSPCAPPCRLLFFGGHVRENVAIIMNMRGMSLSKSPSGPSLVSPLLPLRSPPFLPCPRFSEPPRRCLSTHVPT